MSIPSARDLATRPAFIQGNERKNVLAQLADAMEQGNATFAEAPILSIEPEQEDANKKLITELVEGTQNMTSAQLQIFLYQALTMLLGLGSPTGMLAMHQVTSAHLQSTTMAARAAMLTLILKEGQE